MQTQKSVAVEPNMVLMMISAGFMSAIVVYGVVLNVFVSSALGLGQVSDISLINELVLAAVVTFILSYSVRRWLLKSAIGKLQDRTNLTFADKVKLFTVPHLISTGLSEAVVLFGFVVTYRSLEFGYFVPFALAGLAQMIWYFPTAQRISKQVDSILEPHRAIR